MVWRRWRREAATQARRNEWNYRGRYGPHLQVGRVEQAMVNQPNRMLTFRFKNSVLTVITNNHGSTEATRASLQRESPIGRSVATISVKVQGEARLPSPPLQE